MQISLVVAIASLAIWVVLVFVTPVQSGVIHLLLAVGATLLVRWWGETR